MDGHDFAPEAARRGAVAVLGREAQLRKLCLPDDVAVLAHPDPLRALGLMAAGYFRNLGAQLYAVTGSAGKSTSKELAYLLLKDRVRTVRSPASYNNEIGFPLTLLQADRRTEVVVAEMAQRQRGDIAHLCRLAPPRRAGITRIGSAHVGKMGSLQAVAEGKAEILAGLERGGEAVLPADDPFYPLLRRKCRGGFISFGLFEDAQVRIARARNRGERGWVFDVSVCGRDFRDIRLPLLGRHSLANAALAIGLCRAHIGRREDLLVLGEAEPLPGRLQWRRDSGCRFLFDGYNANPEAVREALWVLRHQVKGRRKIAVLATMRELGRRSAAAHRRAGEDAARLGLDALFAVGAYAGFVAAGAKRQAAGQMQVASFASKDALVRRLRKALRPGDVVLWKGSRSEKLEECLEAL